MSDAPEALVLADVTHGYDSGTPVVRDVTLTLAAGEVVCLLGPSGCGKTTSLRLAAGLERPWAGPIRMGGRLVEGMDDDESGVRHLPPERRRVGFLFQDFALFPHLRVGDNIAFGLKGQPRARVAERVGAVLAAVGMADSVRAWPHQLSGGQQQRVALARALAPNPALLLDEPFSGLDTSLRRTVRDRALRVLREAGVAALMVTHDPEEAMFMADRIALMQAGQVVQLDTPMGLHRHPKSPFAVRFFSQTNEWAGRVRDGALDTPLGVFPASGLRDGAAARLLTRPQALVPTARTGAADILARVVSVRPLGHQTILLLTQETGAAGDLPLVACVPGPAPCAAGETIALRVEPQACFVFADDHGGEPADDRVPKRGPGVRAW
ncbi:ABC transporter ATP-binding protein [Roseospira visakhapatnamensis]|uniref:Iron(III) transport system ATP-binding protein n=1 Tax=Roseospira visakhapatnamensis TaxID=390880 RepID=A0A7W6RGP6_9PROT|nr:ABC transporter ATP-binding protein [Roseospira visakhapatnamensis]MBB4267987.1 iron(III) transport system ATP-binding protein [Roseospira visakhapatnamensis]